MSPTKPTVPALTTAMAVSVAQATNSIVRQRLERQSHAAGAQLPGGEHVERAGDEDRDCHGQQRRAGAQPRVHRPLEVAREPEHHAAHARGVGERQQHAHQRAAGARQHHPRQQQPRRAPAAGEQVHQCYGSERAGDRRRLHHDGGGAGDHGEQRADGGAAGDPEHVRVGEGVAEQRLQQHARERQQTTDAESRQHARQPHGDEHVTRGLIACAGERRERPRQADAGAADEERGHKHRGREHQRGPARLRNGAPRASFDPGCALAHTHADQGR